MPPVIKLYTDPKCTKPHSGEIGIIDAGADLKQTIYCRNEGNGSLKQMKAQLASVDGKDFPGDINSPPDHLDPGKVWTVTIQGRVEPNEKCGLRRAEIRISGRFIE